MKNYVEKGDTLTLTAPATLTSGSGALVGAIFAVASDDAASGATFEGVTTGVFDLAAATSQSWTVGAAIYWDNAAKNCTTTSSGNTKIGVAVAAKGASDTVGRVRLNGAF